MKDRLSLFPYEMENVFSIQEVKQKASWGISALNVPSAWKKAKGKGVKVAVLDSGCDLDHPDLKNNLLPGANFINPRKKPWDDNNHGTHVCGIIASENNDIGVVGVAPECKIIPVKVLDNAGNGSERTVSEGIRWAVDKGKADFICMSLGAPNPVNGVEKAIKYATSKGVICFVAAGNSGNTKKVFYPANYPETIAIGSIDENKRRSHFSNTGHNLDFMAPGSKILSTVPDDWYAVLSGTSMANPFIVGIAALLLSYSRDNEGIIKLDSKDYYVKIFKQHTIPIANPKMKKNRFYEGFGIVDPEKLFQSLKSFMLELML